MSSPENSTKQIKAKTKQNQTHTSSQLFPKLFLCINNGRDVSIPKLFYQAESHLRPNSNKFCTGKEYYQFYS